MNMQKTMLKQLLNHETSSVLLKTGASKNTPFVKSYGEKKMSKVTSKADSKKLLREWKIKLYNQGKLNEREINKRAREFARKGIKP